jgi:hypothetical protein
LNALPTIGYSGVLTSYITAVKWLRSGGELLQEGVDKVVVFLLPKCFSHLLMLDLCQYSGQPFKVATISRWVVVLSSTQHVDDMRKASDEVLSFRAAVAEVRFLF